MEEEPRAAKFLRFVRGYLHRLLGRHPGSTHHERDPDVELVQLPLIDGQGELTCAGRGR